MFTIITLFVSTLVIKVIRTLHDIYAVAIVFVLEERRMWIIGGVVGGFLAVLIVQHTIEWTERMRARRPRITIERA